MKALIIGCRGQDGKWLSENLSTHGYEVFGIHKPTITPTQNSKISPKEKKSLSLKEYSVDFSIYKTAVEYLDQIQPKYIFNLAAVHDSSVDMKNTEISDSGRMQNCHVEITHNLLQWISEKNRCTKLAVALTSQMYSGDHNRTEISENSVTQPQNIYGKTKLESFDLLRKYRNEKGIFASGLILFNHTSVYAKPNFLFKVLAKQIMEFERNIRQKITINNADYEIDICDAQEVCEAMRLTLESENPIDYIISSGNLVTIRSIVKEAAQLLNININNDDILSTNNEAQKNVLLGDPKKIFTDLGWQSKTSPAQLLAKMVEYEIQGQ
jgi:GDPmannose 4,6-dehydratase